jgi:hypothetical protein
MREYNALCKRRRAHEEAKTYRSASIICSIYNVNRGKDQDPVTPDDLMGKKKAKQTPEQILESVKSLHAMLGGKTPEV